MKLLITGAHGMVGRSLVKKLKQIGDVRLLTPSRQELNLLGQDAVNHYLKIQKPEIIISFVKRIGLHHDLFLL